MSINFNHVTNDISASAGSVTIDGSPAGGGAWVWLSTVTANNSATVDIETTLDATYANYLLLITGLTAPSGELRCQFKTAGAYVSSGTYVYHTAQTTTATTYAAVGGANTTFAAVFSEHGASGVELCITIQNPADATLQKGITYTGHGISNATGSSKGINGWAVNSFTTALTGLRFYNSAGNLVVGTFRLYGIKNS